MTLRRDPDREPLAKTMRNDYIPWAIAAVLLALSILMLVQ